MSGDGPLLLTIGHSRRSLAEFLRLLVAHGVHLLVDVRALPRSRRHPQFGGPALAAALAPEGIEYRHAPGLGGMRKPRAGSRHVALREAAFRGYADHMETAEFARGLEALVASAAGRTAAVMCAEADPRQCHRSLLSDALTARGVRVEHIRSAGFRTPHVMTPSARVEGDSVVYDAGRLALGD